MACSADATLVFFVANQGLLHLCDRVMSMPVQLQRRAISELYTAQKQVQDMTLNRWRWQLWYRLFFFGCAALKQADALVDLFRACSIPPPELKPIPSKFITELEVSTTARQDETGTKTRGCILILHGECWRGVQDQMQASSPSSQGRSPITRQTTFSNVLTSTTEGLTAATALSSLKEYDDEDQPSDAADAESPGNASPDLM